MGSLFMEKRSHAPLSTNQFLVGANIPPHQSGVFPHQQLTFFIPCKLVLQRCVVHLHVAAGHLDLHLLLLLVLRWEVRRQLAHRRAALFFNFTPSQSPPSWPAAVSETERWVHDEWKVKLRRPNAMQNMQLQSRRAGTMYNLRFLIKILTGASSFSGGEGRTFFWEQPLLHKDGQLCHLCL